MHKNEHIDASQFWVNRLVTEEQKSLRFDKKYILLCSEDEQRSYGFGTT